MAAKTGALQLAAKIAPANPAMAHAQRCRTSAAANPTHAPPPAHLRSLHDVGNLQETFLHKYDWMVRPNDLPSNPYLWSVEQTSEWLQEIGLGEYIEIFEDHCVDGNTLFYISEEEFVLKLGLTKVGLMKRLLLARLWILQDYRRSQQVLKSAHAKKDRAIVKLRSTQLLAAGGAAGGAASAASAVVEDDEWKTDRLLTNGNAPEWQVKSFKTIRNAAGGFVLIMEVAMTLLRLNPMFHLVSLLPLLFSGFGGAAAATRF